MVPAGWWAPLEEEHRGSRCGSRGAEQGAGRRAQQGGAGRSLWISTRKATLVLPAALRAVQL